MEIAEMRATTRVAEHPSVFRTKHNGLSAFTASSLARLNAGQNKHWRHPGNVTRSRTASLLQATLSISWPSTRSPHLHLLRYFRSAKSQLIVCSECDSVKVTWNCAHRTQDIIKRSARPVQWLAACWTARTRFPAGTGMDELLSSPPRREPTQPPME
jgi:hypothetical protein